MIVYFDMRRAPLFKDMFKRSGVCQINQFRNYFAFFSLRSRVLRRLPSILLFPRPRFARGDDKIIAFDSYTSIRHLRWYRKLAPDKRIIFWCWNIINDADRLQYFPEGIEIWSFSLNDCRRYHLRHNTQFFFDCLADDAERCRQQPVSYPRKALFIGRDKGRVKALEELRTQVEAAGVQVEMQIAPPLKGQREMPFEKLLPYAKTIERVKEADVLLDLATNPDTGLSLRCMESLFFGKKLITNNTEVLEADFYDPANIYVLGHDSRTFEEFFSCERVLIDPQIRDYYLLSNWLKRFDEGGVTV
jgi:hypothetical protein